MRRVGAKPCGCGAGGARRGLAAAAPAQLAAVKALQIPRGTPVLPAKALSAIAAAPAPKAVVPIVQAPKPAVPIVPVPKPAVPAAPVQKPAQALSVVPVPKPSPAPSGKAPNPIRFPAAPSFKSFVKPANEAPKVAPKVASKTNTPAPSGKALNPAARKVLPAAEKPKAPTAHGKVLSVQKAVKPAPAPLGKAPNPAAPKPAEAAKPKIAAAPAAIFPTPLHVWNLSFWSVLHLIASEFPVKPTLEQQNTHLNWFTKSLELLPSAEQKAALLEWAKTHPINVESRSALSNWVLAARNYANKQAGKDELSLEQLKKQLNIVVEGL